MSSYGQVKRAFRDLNKHIRLQEDGIACDVARFDWIEQLKIEVTEHLLRNERVSPSETPGPRRGVRNSAATEPFTQRKSQSQIGGEGTHLKDGLAQLHKRDPPAHALPLARAKGELDVSLHVTTGRRGVQLGEPLRPEHVGVWPEQRA